MTGDRQRGILQTTRWSLVRRAAAGGTALEEWVGSCWLPLYVWTRRKGWSHEDSSDAVQDFLGKVCHRELLAKADPARGKLRSWLLVSFGNHLASIHAAGSRLKRGGGKNALQLDWESVEKEYQESFADEPDPARAYERAWAIALMEEAMRRLSEHYANTGRAVLHDALLPALEGAPNDTSFEELAVRLSMKAPALRQAAVRFRQRYRLFLVEVAGERLGITDEALLHQELRKIFTN